jgi:filamentous hemagglutinin family protein
MRIDQLTSEAIANWESFSIEVGQSVDISQPGVDAVLLNRVIGADPSQLLGQLNANGRVYLINPNGVLVGRDASINTAEFMASALDVADEDFLDGGDLSLSGDTPASVVNLGQITAANGDVILIAHTVENAGEIAAEHGVAALAAGQSVVLSPEADQRILVKTGLGDSSANEGVANRGLIEAAQAELKAAGGNIYELAVNQSGIIRATGIEERDGRVLITAEDGVVGHSGTLQAANQDGSGGEVLLGGDYRGSNPEIANAANTVVTEDGRIDVSATAADADAGRAIVWSGQGTRFFGQVVGRGGAEGGDGAFAEVSGLDYLDYRGSADLSAPFGEAGKLLLDPASLTVQATGSDSVQSTGGDPFLFEDVPSPSILLVSTLESQLVNSDVALEGGSITVDDPVSWTSGNSLFFNSLGFVNVNADLDAGAGATGGAITFGLGFIAESFGPGGTASEPDLVVDPNASVTARSVAVKRFDSGIVVGNSFDGPMGQIDFAGQLVTDTLDLQYAALNGGGLRAGGIEGPVNIVNSANRIGQLTTSVSSGQIKGPVTIVDGEGGLTIDGQLKEVWGNIEIVTEGDLTLGPDALVTTSGFERGDIVLASRGGSFINNSTAGAAAIAPDSPAPDVVPRFLIYSDNPTDIVKGGLAADPVYDTTYVDNAPATITQTGNRFLYRLAPILTLTANDLSKTQGEPNPMLTFSVSGLVGGDAEADVLSGTPSLATTADSTSPIGDYTIDISTGTIVMSDYNYGLNLIDGILSVESEALTELLITANDFTRFYGDANPSFTASYDGFVHGDDASVVSGLQFTTSANMQSDVGNYTITPFGASATDYNINYANGTLAVNPRLLTIRARDLSKFYGDTLPGFSAEFGGLASFDTEADISGLQFASAATNERADAGSYEITPRNAANPNYNITLESGTATVNPRPVTITAPSVSREYGAANPALVASGSNFVFAEFNSSLVDFNEVPVDADVATYPITPTAYSDSNYAPRFVSGTLEVTPAPLELSADSFSREYGLANPAPTFTDGSYRLGQSFDDVFSDFQLSTSATQASSVGAYPIELAATQINDNYDVTLNDGTLTVTKAPLTIAPIPAQRLYGDANPEFDLQVISGLRNGDSKSVVRGERYQAFAGPASSVGFYPIRLISGTATNYELSFSPSTLTVLPRPLTISAEDVSREYGDPNPTFTASFDNLAEFDTAADFPNLNFSTPGEENSIPLRYGITPSGATNDNYDISFEQGFLTVTKAPLSLRLNDVSRVYGDGNDLALSQVTIDSADGFKLDDGLNDITLSNFATTATQTSDVGGYPVTQDISSQKYDVSIDQRANLIVTERPLTALIDLTAAERTRTYGEAPIDFSQSLIVGNLANGDSPESVLDVTDPTVVNSDVGEYEFQANLLDSNYTLQSFANRNFFIQQKRVDLNFQDVSNFFGEEEPDFFVFLDTEFLVPGDTPQEVLSPPTAGTDRFTDVGRYAIEAASIDSNYRVDSVTGFYDIEARPLYVYLDNVSRVYGSQNPSDYDPFLRDGVDSGLVGTTPLRSVLDISGPAQTVEIGSYALRPSLIDDNYTLEEFSGSIAVTRRPIRVTHETTYTRPYGSDNPQTKSFVDLVPSNIVNGGVADFETIDDVVTLELPGIDAAVGDYAFADLIRTNPNYEVTLADELTTALTIQQRRLFLGVGNLFRSYGDPAGTVELVDNRAADGDFGLAPFDSFADVLRVELPGPEAEVGRYTVGLMTTDPNYRLAEVSPIDFSQTEVPFVQIDPRSLTVNLPGINRLYGDPNRRDGVSIESGSLPDFATRDDLFTVEMPGVGADPGLYQVTELPDNPNYEIAVSSGSTEMIIRRRDLSVKVENSFGFFGDDSFGAALAISGDGFAPIDDPQSVFQVTSLEGFDRNSRSGYYLLDSFESDEARYNITFEPGVLTILPRPVGLQISGLSRDFDSVEDLNAFQSEENRVVPAEVTNLRPGDTIDDAFPIIRYQIVDAEDAVPQLPVQPTAETVEVPDVDALVNDDSLVASGVRLKASVSPGSGSGVTRSGDLSDAAEGFIDRFITVLDGFDTERDYVLTSVDNGFASFKLPSTPQEETETEYVYSEGGDIGYIRIGSPLTRLRPGPRIEMPDRPEITISGPNDPPPTLDSLFGGDDFEIGIDMIMDYVNRFMDGNEAYVFEEGSLFYEITRSTSGSKEDITPFRVRRFFERNADNPDLLNFLAVPLAEYSEAFLEKDSSTYTEAESEFAELLSDHLEFTRDKVAARMEENRKAWAARENETPPNMVDMFGKDVPWDEFMSDAAGDYVTELLEAKAAGAVAGGALGGGAAAAGTAAVAGALFPNSIGLGAAALGVKTTLTAGAAAAGPAVIVAATITGSIARGIQVFENEERKQFYMDFQNSVGQSISVDSFSLSSDSENEANLNKTILTGAITGMLYSG